MKATGTLLYPLAVVALLAGCGSGSTTKEDTTPLAVTSFKPASTVIGQPDFTSASSAVSNGRAAAANTTDGTYGSPLVQNGILYVPDYFSNRILGFRGIPTTNGANASFVLGQDDFTSTGSGTTDSTLSGPESIRYADGKFFVLDYSNNRVLIWNKPPTRTGTAADIVVGQPDFTSNACVSSKSGLCAPDDIFVAGGKLIVADSGNNRVLIWNSIPTTSGVPADVVLGQSDFTRNGYNDDNQDGFADGSPSNRTFSYPAGLWSDGTRLFVCDSNNNRVLIWSSLPTSDFAPANLVVGQSDFAHAMFNDDDQDGFPGQATARTFDNPYYVTSDGTHLFVSDSNNNRVLVWETMPTTDFAPADKVLGQATMTAYVPNDDDQDGSQDATPSARAISSPTGLFIYGHKLFVSDVDNNRILVFNF